MGLTLNGGYGGGGGSYPTLEVTITNGSATSVTATLGSTVVNLTYDSAAGVWRGTLKAFGTWTVEASNGEKTVSVTVDVTNVAVYTVGMGFGPLPSGYTELEYIESNGYAFIADTGLYLKSQGYLYVKTKFLELAQADNISPWLFGGCAYGTRASIALVDVLRTDGYSPYPGLQILAYGVQAYPTTVISQNQWYTLEADCINHTMHVNDALISATWSTYDVSALRGNEKYAIFGVNYDGGNTTYTKPRFTGKMKYLVLGQDASESGMIAYFIAAKRNSDGAIGLYDVVRDLFFTSSTSTSFIAGPEV